MSQLSFAFETPDEKPALMAGQEPATALSLEDMARRLEAHPDYRVLRRLVPIMDFGPLPASPSAVGQPSPGLRILILDTETTGLSQTTDRIIELAMLLVSVDTGSGQPFGVLDTFEGFEDPGMPIPEVARQVTGITDEMVRGQRLDDEQVQAMVARADLIVAHNAGFDRPFVEARFAAFAAKPWACSFMDIDWKARGAESAKLSALAQDRGWFYDAHRALVDCHALLQVLASPDAQGSGTGLSRLIEAMGRPSYRLRATGAPFEGKDRLKARGYRWDAEARVWFTHLDSAEALAEELAWLGAGVYGGRRAQVEVETLDALTRFSARAGRIEHHPLPPVSAADSRDQ
ncbi:MAG: polymerase subunit epsilon [Betaproteobacteria bacterium]|nr:polymerase subunit epsilon [Betaproteobacteria bacterium]